jgi:hypothetical protein
LKYHSKTFGTPKRIMTFYPAAKTLPFMGRSLLGENGRKDKPVKCSLSHSRLKSLIEGNRIRFGSSAFRRYSVLMSLLCSSEQQHGIVTIYMPPLRG